MTYPPKVFKRQVPCSLKDEERLNGLVYFATLLKYFPVRDNFFYRDFVLIMMGKSLQYHYFVKFNRPFYHRYHFLTVKKH